MFLVWQLVCNIIEELAGKGWWMREPKLQVYKNKQLTLVSDDCYFRINSFYQLRPDWDQPHNSAGEEWNFEMLC